MSGLGGLGCGALSDLDGMITGVVPVRRSEVAHELHVKWTGNAHEVRSADMLSHLAMQHQNPQHLEHDGHVSAEGVRRCTSYPPPLAAAAPVRPYTSVLLPPRRKCAVGNRDRTTRPHVRSVLCPIGQSLSFHCLVPQ